MTLRFCVTVTALAWLGAVLPLPAARATPSTTYWTPCTIDLQSPDTTHVTVDNYFSIGRDGPGKGGESFPVDLGLTFGQRLSGPLQVEYGFDWLEPTDDPLFLNAKIGVPEGALGRNAPAVQLGLFNFGLKSGVTNQNVVHLVVGRSLPHDQGRLHLSAYWGNPGVLRSSAGDRENTGFMVGYDRVLVPGKVILAADYASGDNVLGGGGVGLYYYFNPNVDLLFGPVWFNDKGLNGDMKWTMQLDLNF
jgi:hypothetical protein